MKVASERKLQVIAKAEELFSEKGYLATSVRDLAEALGIEAASLYSHVKSKEDLLWEIAKRCAEDFFQTVKPISETDQRTEKKLRDMIIAHFEVIARNLNASAVYIREWRHLTEPRKSEYNALRQDYEAMFRDVVRKGVEENLFKHYPEGFSARTILSAINWTHTWYRPGGDMGPQEIGENLAGILLGGLVRSI